LLLYLDLNCFNRPFDDQTQERVALETAAVLLVLERIVAGVDVLLWSAALDFENSRHPLADRRQEIGRWRNAATANVSVSDQVGERARQLTSQGFGAMDALHLALAEAGRCARFLTCDDRLLRTAKAASLKVRVQNPRDYVEEHDHG
jgi:predicted nucleic acid-binding protein